LTVHEVTTVVTNYKTLDLVIGVTEGQVGHQPGGLLGCYPDLPLVLIDNGSADRSTQYIEWVTRRYENVSAILNRGRTDLPEEPPKGMTAQQWKIRKRIAESGNVGHGIALHQAAMLCKTPYMLALDSDCVILKCGFVEAMLARLGPGFYAVGLNVQPRRRKFPVIHPSVMMFDVEAYKTLTPFALAGGPAKENFESAREAGYTVVDFPANQYIEHLFHGTRKRLHKIPHIRSKPIWPDEVLPWVRTEYRGGYFE